MQFARDSRDLKQPSLAAAGTCRSYLLMLDPSSILMPLLSVTVARSDPARSIKESLPTLT